MHGATLKNKTVYDIGFLLRQHVSVFL